MSLTKQEMFDRAYRGLASQEWKQCLNANADGCIYKGSDGMRCAWGWVDRGIPEIHNENSLDHMRHAGVGVIYTLDADSYAFALNLQSAHDDYDSPNAMRNAFEDLASEYSLTIPVTP